MTSTKQPPLPPLKPGQCGRCGHIHGPEYECPIRDIGYAPGFEPPSLKDAVRRDPEAWAAYMRNWRAKRKAEKIAAAHAAAAGGDDDDTVH